MLEEWSVKRRIFVYHTLTVLAALVTLLVVSGGVMGWVTHRYQEWSRSAIDDRAEQVQTLLSDSSGTDWGRLDAQLRELGYHLRVGQNGRELYSSLDPFQEDAYQRFSADAVWPPNGTHTIQNDGILMIGTQNGPYTIVAMSRPHIPEVFGRQRPQSEAVMLALITSGLTAIVLIVLLSLLFTNHQVKQLMRPVNALADAAQRVERGDLSRPVDYHGKDEFASVCAAFDHMQRHLLAEREKNAAYEQARTDLVAGISHDLRTPLTRMKLQATMLPDPQEQKDLLADIDEMEKMLDGYLSFVSGEGGEKAAFVDMNELILSVLNKFRNQNAMIRYKTNDQVSAIQGREQALKRAMTNIIGNAFKYGKTVSVDLESNNRKMEIVVDDDGPGIPADKREEVFKAFYRLDESRNKETGGVGLGLSIAKDVITSHGGTIELLDSPIGGLRVLISIPL